MENPQICIQCLGCYNEGTLNFKWVNIEDITDINETLEQFKKTNCPKITHEELMIADYSDFPNLGEFPDYEKMQEIIDAINQQPNYAEAIKDFIDNGDDINDFDEVYQGQYEDMTEFAYELVRECYDLKPMGNLADYFDYEKFGRDLEIGGDYWISDNGHVFRYL